MYSSSSSSSQHSAPPNHPTTNHNLMRYDSAPSSFLSNVSETVSSLGLGQHHHQQHQQFFSAPGDSLTMNVTESTRSRPEQQRNTLTLLQDSYRMNNSPVKGSSAATTTTSNLIRHSSSPAGFLNQLTSASELGFPTSKGMDNYNNNQGACGSTGHNLSRLGAQLSFTKQDHHALSQISELNECSMLEGMSSHDNHGKMRASTSQQPRASSSSGRFSLSSWEENNDGFSFSGPSNKRNRHNLNDDILNGLDQQEIAFEMASMDRIMHIPQDSVPCKIRAKRGCATHPRSIAERERRTRISGKLKKLQELVPNMDKQTSYADMLDLAVQHIKGLQTQIQKLNGDLDRCTCGCKEDVHS